MIRPLLLVAHLFGLFTFFSFGIADVLQGKASCVGMFVLASVWGTFAILEAARGITPARATAPEPPGKRPSGPSRR